MEKITLLETQQQKSELWTHFDTSLNMITAYREDPGIITCVRSFVISDLLSVSSSLTSPITLALSSLKKKEDIHQHGVTDLT